MKLATGAIVTIIGLVESVLHEPNNRSDEYFPPTENDMIPAKYEGKWPEHPYRYLYKTGCEATKAMVLGWTTRNVGSVWHGIMTYHHEYGKEWEPGGMSVEAQYRVWIVMPLGVANRYRLPIAVLPEQIVKSEI